MDAWKRRGADSIGWERMGIRPMLPGGSGWPWQQAISSRTPDYSVGEITGSTWLKPIFERGSSKSETFKTYQNIDLPMAEFKTYQNLLVNTIFGYIWQGWTTEHPSIPAIWVCLKIVYPCVPNGFADHYPVFKWLLNYGNIPNIFRQTLLANWWVWSHRLWHGPWGLSRSPTSSPSGEFYIFGMWKTMH